MLLAFTSKFDTQMMKCSTKRILLVNLILADVAIDACVERWQRRMLGIDALGFQSHWPKESLYFVRVLEMSAIVAALVILASGAPMLVSPEIFLLSMSERNFYSDNCDCLSSRLPLIFGLFLHISA